MSYLLRALATVLLGFLIAAEPVIAQTEAEKKPTAEKARPDKAAADKAAADKAAPERGAEKAALDNAAAEKPASALKLPARNNSISTSLVGMAILLVMAVILENALAVIFNWRVFLAYFSLPGVKTIIMIVISWVIVNTFDIDVMASLIAAYKSVDPSSVSGPASRLITALVLTSAIAGVNRIMIAIGFRKVSSQEDATSRPPAAAGADAAPSAPLAETAPTAPETVPLPDIPDGLVDALRSRNCVLVAGPALARMAGWPSDLELIARLQGAAVKLNALPTSSGSPEATVVVDPGRFIELGLTRLGESVRPVLADLAASMRARPIYQELARLPFQAVVTTALDQLLQAAFPGMSVAMTADPALKERLFKREPFLLKVHGDLNQTESRLTLTARQFEEMLETNSVFAEFWNGLFASRNVLFFGFDLNEIEAYARRALRLSAQRTSQHYALMPVAATEREALSTYARQQYNLELLPLDGASYEDQATRFIEALVPASRDLSGGRDIARVPHLELIKLQDIGPFDDLTIAMDSGLTVLLGDNGVGKSTILKAIGVALAGKDAERYADRLIRVGRNEAKIILKMSTGTEYVTVLRRRETGAEVAALNDRPLSSGYFAIGFPPVRTISWHRVEPARMETKGWPKAEDILPLIAADGDARLDGLKQWVLSIEFESSQGNKTYLPVLADFFKVAGTLALRMPLEYRGLSEDNRVLVGTQDGNLPLEALSQGTGSLLGWVGVLMQRLYMVYGGDAPRQAPALILVDEIDAHMHPAWQWGLLERLRETFKNAQFIVSSHSPLIVAGLPASQVNRYIRDDEGKVRESPLEDYMMKGRADQLLTSSLFGLDSTLDPQTTKRMDRYKDLRARRPSLTAEERAELQDLEAKIEYSIPPPGETPMQHAMALVQAVLESQLPLPQFDEARRQAAEQARKLLVEVEQQKGIRKRP